MPLERFLVLNNAIPAIEAQNELKLVQTIFYANNPGKDGNALKRYMDILANNVGQGEKRIKVIPGITAGVEALNTASEIKNEREKKIAEWEKRKRDWEKRKNNNTDKV